MTKEKKQAGRPVLWRHHTAGVLIGYISGSPVPGHVRMDCVRLRSWRGGRLDCASVATKGVREGDVITERVLRDVALEGSVEIYEMDAGLVEEALNKGGQE